MSIPVISLLLFVCFNNLACSQSNPYQDIKPTGKILVDILFFDSATNDFTKSLSGDNEILVYGKYLVEKNNVTNQTSINENEVTQKSYTTAYFFIDSEKKLCSEYDSLHENAKRIAVYPLNNKKSGFRFEDGIDYFKDSLDTWIVDEEIINGKRYTKITTDILQNSNKSPLRITAYLDTALTSLPLHLSKTLDQKYKGWVDRLDIETVGKGQKLSYRLNYKPGKLGDSVNTILEKWKEH